MTEILSPDNAVISAKQEIIDRFDKTAALRVTVHEVKGKTYTNTWRRQNGNWSKLIAEKEHMGAPNMWHAHGELLRLANFRGNDLNGDIALRLAVDDLIRKLAVKAQKADK